MKFTIQRRQLVGMLKVVLTNPSLAKHDRDRFLRIEAANARLVLKSNKTEAGAAAFITEKGVAFILYHKLLPLIESFKNRRMLTVTIDPDGFHINRFHISSDIWWAIYDNPESAPKSVPDFHRILYNDNGVLCDPDDECQFVWRNNLQYPPKSSG